MLKQTITQTAIDSKNTINEGLVSTGDSSKGSSYITRGSTRMGLGITSGAALAPPGAIIGFVSSAGCNEDVVDDDFHRPKNSILKVPYVTTIETPARVGIGSYVGAVFLGVEPSDHSCLSPGKKLINEGIHMINKATTMEAIKEVTDDLAKPYRPINPKLVAKANANKVENAPTSKDTYQPSM